MKSSLQNIAEEQGLRPKIPIYEVEKASPTARLAVYDLPTLAPEILDISCDNYEEFIGLVSTRTYQLSQEKGGIIPFSVIREAVENLVHAYFNEVVVTILDCGNTIKISDQGSGITDKEKAFRQGFSTATFLMKKVIKGVGSGLPLVKEIMSSFAGEVIIEDNLNQGTVVTLKVPTKKPGDPDKQNDQENQPPTLSLGINLTDRQKRTLFLVTELGEAGPSKIAAELDASLSTAYRDLAHLEELQLIQSDEQGKRSLTNEGVKQLDGILHS